MIHHVNLIGMTNMIGHTKVNFNAVKFSIKKVIPILIILKNMNIEKHRQENLSQNVQY